jgi:hypothetical protein
MMILAHRGVWREPAERNTLAALTTALDAGFGIETDIRDRKGRLVISHDPPGDDALALSEFLARYNAFPSPGVLALNIKADGLQAALVEELTRGKIAPDRYFVFDMAVPDALGYLKRGMPCFTRQSEVEPVSAFSDRASGIWLDCFDGDWITRKDVLSHCLAGRRVALVSSELHGRDFRAAWQEWREAYRSLRREGCGDRMMLCTDHPFEARTYFDAAD